MKKSNRLPVVIVICLVILISGAYLINEDIFAPDIKSYEVTIIPVSISGKIMIDMSYITQIHLYDSGNNIIQSIDIVGSSDSGSFYVATFECQETNSFWFRLRINAGLSDFTIGELTVPVSVTVTGNNYNVVFSLSGDS